MVRIPKLRTEVLIDPLQLVLVPHEQADDGQHRRESSDNATHFGEHSCVPWMKPCLRVVLDEDGIVTHAVNVVFEVDDGEKQPNHRETRGHEIKITPLLEYSVVLFLRFKLLLLFALRK